MGGRRPTAAAPALPGADAPVPSDLVELGVLRGPYGIRGWSHVQSHAPDSPVLRGSRRWWLLCAEGPRAVEITGVRRQGAGLVAHWAGCDTPEDAQALRGARVTVARTDFPPAGAGEHYWVDLVGMRVVNRAGLELGRVEGVRSNGVHDLIEVRDELGAQRLLPMVERHLDAIDAAAGRILVDWEADW